MKPFKSSLLHSLIPRYLLLVVLSLLLLSSLAKAELGAVDVLVSRQGTPQESFELRIAGQDYKTDAFGYATVALTQGSYEVSLKDGATYRSIPFAVVSEERTQLIVNIFKDSFTSDLTEPSKVELGKSKAAVGPVGKVSLKISSVNGEPIQGARVFARGVSIKGVSDRQGQVSLELPLGEQAVSVTHPKFSTQSVRNIKVTKGNVESRNIELTPTGLVLEDFVVLAPNLKGSIQALIEVRRKAADLSDVMSAEQMAKTGDSDAAGSLKRVTGLTLKDGKYVYVRGLGERYSATLMNGVALPSPDPSRRVVPLDLFPVQFLDSMIIQKSYSPNQPGEFGGGVVQLQTKSMPKKFFFKAAISQTQNSNDGNMQTYNGGGSDWFGVDDGARKLPENLGTNYDRIFENNRHTLQQQDNETLPDLSFSLGNSYKMGPLKLGYTTSGLYKDDINFQVEERNRYEKSSGTLKREDELVREKTQKERTVGGIAGVQFELLKNHKLKVDYINLRNTTDYVAVMTGRNTEGNRIRENQQEWAARTLQTVMLQGDSKIEPVNDLKIAWNFAQSKARRDEPYRVNSRYSPNEQGVYVFNPQDNTNYERRYYDLQERAETRGLSLSMPFPFFKKRKGNAEVGLSQTRKVRVSGMTRFNVEPGVGRCSTDFSASLDTIFADCPNAFRVTNDTRATDNYNANQNLTAYYFKTQWPLLKSLNLNTGMRFENSVQTVNTVTPFSSDQISSQLNTRDWLPGTSLTWKFNKKMQLRLAYSETISRPDLRELSDTLWQDFETGFDVQGNPGLRATVINSYDARWEWYFSQKENVSFGVFYKDFKDPIEQEFTAGSDPVIKFFNVDGAIIYGAEIETSKNLGFISSWLRRFSLAGNYAYIFSDVRLGELTNSEAVDTNRPLQGQSNYTANVLLDYEHEPINLNASLAYNVYGKRIAYAAPEGLPNVWEMPFHQLDFVIRKKIGKTMAIQAKIKNILNPKVRLEQEGEIWQAWRQGQTYTLGVSMGI